ncbi:hypothetical protein [Lignipirellula cremea]|uniref:Uncharacterized protein n=1 Tax=Lignipirellula cremea TaxID=2528010 RepID=A0A518DL64_9BACT|nr:hypothetical protein [Lignipirellula cremea]QDU92576.1 hypothetical protein Pla8534_03240 [Lignipirellula cremea]
MHLLFPLLLLFAAPPGDLPEPPPLTASQVTSIQTLIRETQTADARLQAELLRRQDALTAAYARYQLDAEEVQRLQSEVLATQTALLGNYHRLQVELRGIVGEARFQRLHRRIDLHLRKQKKLSQETTP